jgi:hypothetical protein
VSREYNGHDKIVHFLLRLPIPQIAALCGASEVPSTLTGAI